MNDNQLEKIILAKLCLDDVYLNKVIIHLSPEIFSSEAASKAASLINNFYNEYQTRPTEDALLIELDDTRGLSETLYKDSRIFIQNLFKKPLEEAISALNDDWLYDKTEDHIRQQKCKLAVLQSLNILEGEEKKLTKEAIPDILKRAVSVSLNTELGHDYIADASARYDNAHKKENKIPFHIEALNLKTGGGAHEKSLVIPIAPTGVGKSFFMTAWAAYLMKIGIDVFYITLELSEEKVAERIDANLMNIKLSDLDSIPKDTFMSKIAKIKSNTLGKLVIKEEPSSEFNALKMKSLINSYISKYGKKPRVVFIDYLNLVSSYKFTNADNSYGSIKAAAEEIRSVALEMGLVAVAPTQTNRLGINAADYGLNEVSDSIGIAFFADLMIALIETEDMLVNGQLKCKLLKNRWGSLNHGTFMIAVDKSKMQMYDLDDLSKVTRQETESKPEPKSKTSELIF